MSDVISDNDRTGRHGGALYSRLLADGHLQLHYQPIVDLRSGQVLGVEALGRLADNGHLISPGTFLPHLAVPELRDLLFQSAVQGRAALHACRASHPGLRLSLNVEPAVLLEPDFMPGLMACLGSGDPGRLTLEILEGGEFLNLNFARRQLEHLRERGIRVALDDVGSAYSSLMRLKTLPVDVIKLDQGFVRGLHRVPEDLMFVSSIMSLARGLNRGLVVEGVETLEILDAMRVLGVQAAQGYAIARPMPAEALLDWLAGHAPEPATPKPHSLLGAYAAHLCLVEACRALMNQPLKSAWLEGADNPHNCLIGKFFDENGMHDTEFGLAHKRFHVALPAYDTERQDWERAAEELRRTLEVAIQHDPHAASSVRGGAAVGAGLQPCLGLPRL